jgi:hypothetical protein
MAQPTLKKKIRRSRRRRGGGGGGTRRGGGGGGGGDAHLLPMKVVAVSRWTVLAIVLLFSSTNISPYSSATSIKWTPADDSNGGSGGDGKPNAATAPKSQRYWDEHGIERPDYAKTDAEVARERAAKYSGRFKSASETTIRNVFLAVTMIVAPALVFYVYLVRTGRIVAFWDKGSFRLGGSASSTAPFSTAASREETRNARLARFDKKEE